MAYDRIQLNTAGRSGFKRAEGVKLLIVFLSIVLIMFLLFQFSPIEFLLNYVILIDLNAFLNGTENLFFNT